MTPILFLIEYISTSTAPCSTFSLNMFMPWSIQICKIGLPLKLSLNIPPCPFPSLPQTFCLPGSMQLLHMVGTSVFLPLFLSCLLKILLDLPLPPRQPFLLDHSDLGTRLHLKGLPNAPPSLPLLLPLELESEPYLKYHPSQSPSPTCWSTHCFSVCLGLLGIWTQKFNKNFKS